MADGSHRRTRRRKATTATFIDLEEFRTRRAPVAAPKTNAETGYHGFDESTGSKLSKRNGSRVIVEYGSRSPLMIRKMNTNGCACT